MESGSESCKPYVRGRLRNDESFMDDLDDLNDFAVAAAAAVEATMVPVPPSYSNHCFASPFLSLLRLRCRSGNQRQSPLPPLTSIFKSTDSRDDERTAAAGVDICTCVGEE